MPGAVRHRQNLGLDSQGNEFDERSVEVQILRSEIGGAPQGEVKCKVRGPGSWLCRASVGHMKEVSDEEIDVYRVLFQPRILGKYVARLFVNGKWLEQRHEVNVTEKKSYMEKENVASPARRMTDQIRDDFTKGFLDESSDPLTENNLAKHTKEAEKEAKNLTKVEELRVPVPAIPDQEENAKSPIRFDQSVKDPEKKRKIAPRSTSFYSHSKESLKQMPVPDSKTQKCFICNQSFKKLNGLTIDKEFFCKSDFERRFLQSADEAQRRGSTSQPDDFVIGGVTKETTTAIKNGKLQTDLGNINLQVLTYRDCRVATRHFRRGLTYDEAKSTVSSDEGRALVRSIFAKKSGCEATECVVAKVEEVFKAAVRKSALTLQEVEFLAIFAELARAWLLGDLKEKVAQELSVDKKEKKKKKPTKIVEEVEEEDGEESKDMFTGDTRADAWMMY